MEINILTPKGIAIFDSKEIYLDKLYLKFKNDNNSQIQILAYNIDKLDGIKYELLLSLNEIYKLSDIFRSFTDIKDFYEAMIQLIEKDKYKIQYNENNVILSLIVTDIFNKRNEIELILEKKNDELKYDEYIYILSEEIKKLRCQLNSINKLKEENQKIKLPIIMKYL